MKYWTRTTHNFNNETREWEYRKELDKFENKNIFNSLLGVHALDSGRWKTLEEIYHENEEYYEQYKDELYSGADISGIDKSIILSDLELMEKLGFVKSKEI